MTLIKIAKIEDIPRGVMKAFEIEGNEYLVANIEGSFYAVGNRCTHMRAELSKGELKGRIVICPKHHASFDVVTGKAQMIHAHDLPVYRVEIQGNDLFIE